jgi:hypothetical protein
MTTLDTLKVFLEGDSSSFEAAVKKASAAVDAHKKKLERMAAIDAAVGKGAARVAMQVEAAENRKAAAAKRAADVQENAAKRAAAAAERAAKRIEAANAKQQKGGGGFGGMIAGAVHLGAITYVLHQVSAALGAFYKLAEEGARTAAAQKYFENSGKSIEDFRKATHGLVADADLIKKANLADTMGISAEAFKQLATVAHASAAKTGQSFKHMLDSIILGTARESRLLLDNLGIIVDVKQAKLDYAKALKEADKEGKYANLTIKQLAAALSDTAQKEAFMAAAMRDGNGALLEQMAVGKTAADNFDRLAASFDNIKTALGKLFAKESSSAVSFMADELQRMAGALEDIGKFGVTAEGGLGGFLKKLASNPKILLGPLGVAIAIGETAAEGSVEQKFRAEQDWTQMAFDLNNRGVDPNDALQLFTFSLKEQTATLKAMDKPTAALIKEFYELTKALGKLEQYTGGDKALGKQSGPGSAVDPQALADAKAKAAAKEQAAHEKAVNEQIRLYNIRQAWEKELEREFEEAMEAHWDSVMRSMGAAEEARIRAFNERTNGRSTAAAGLGVGDYEGRQVLNEKASADAGWRAGQVGQVSSLIQSLMGGDAGGIGGQIGQMIAGPLGAAIGALIGELLAPLQPVIQLLGHVAQGIVTLLEMALGPVVQALAPLGPALEVLLGAVGLLIGSALAPLIPYIQAVVDGLVFVINGLSWFFIVLSPFVELIVYASQFFIGLITTVMLFDTQLQGLVYGMETITRAMIQSAVDINNGIVSIMRGLGQWFQDTFKNDFGLSRFGRTLSVDDLLIPLAEPIEENTDATVENTRATRDLAQELRNLPQGYKINYALYGATAPAPRLAGGVRAGRNFDGLNNGNFRRRT